MPPLDELNPMSEWVAHELRCQAREAGWVTKTCGVEALFCKRKTALRVISNEFSVEHLLLRSLPDMVLRSPRGTYLVEAKDATSRTDNVAIELYQWLLFLRVCPRVWYCFGGPDHSSRRMDGRMAMAYRLRPHRLLFPRRVTQEWPDVLVDTLRQWIDEASLKPLCHEFGDTDGSNDPFALIRKDELQRFPTVDIWLKSLGEGGFDGRFRQGWEGREEAQASWGHLPPPGGWKSCEEVLS
jgi:hypothetical protein